MEEKRTDMNIAIRMYRDATKGRYERIIVVSNNNYAEPALQAIREDFGAPAVRSLVRRIGLLRISPTNNCNRRTA